MDRKPGHLALDCKKTRQAARIARRVSRNWPCDDHLVADIGEHRAGVVADRFVDIEEEAGDQVVHAELAHFLGEPRQAGDIEEHYDPLLAGRTMIRSQHNAGEHRATDQPLGLSYDPGDKRYGEPDRDDPWQRLW